MSERSGLVSEERVAERDPRWSLVERVLGSSGFAKSSRLRQFLEFVCSAELTGRSKEINEQQVGVHVFGRSKDFSPSDDSIVRSHARLLRKRLDEYFEGEGAAEPIRIRIPKGGYSPVFEEVLVPAADAAGPKQAGSASGEMDQRPRRARIAWYAAAFAALAAAVALAIVLRSSASTPEDYANRFWAQMCNSTRQTVVVPSDTALVIYQVVTGRQVHLQEYINQDYHQNDAPPLIPALNGVIGLRKSPYTNMVDLDFCWRLARSSRADLSRTAIRAPRDLRMPDLKGSNAILIGARRANPWVELFDQSDNFQGLFEPGRGDYVLNRSAASSEQPFYPEIGGPYKQFRAYAIVAYVPGLGPNDRTLLIGGTSSAGTDAGLDFALNSGAFGSFLQQISAGRQTIPWFEVLLKSGNLDARAPTRAEIVAFRKREH